MNTNFRNTLLVTLLACGLIACTSQESNKGGTGGSGAAGSGGAGGRPATDGTLCPLPATPLITDFTYTAGQDPNSVNFGNSTTLQGSEFVYPTTGSYPLTSDVSGSNWHITGTVGDYSGFGLITFNCSVIDASAYKGIQFKISGTVGDTDPMTLGATTLNDAITAEWINSPHWYVDGPGSLRSQPRYQSILRTRLLRPDEDLLRERDTNRGQRLVG